MPVIQRAAYLFKIVDMITGSPVLDALIINEDKNIKVLNKNDGFYVFLNLNYGSYKGKILHKNYEETDFCFVIDNKDSNIKVIMLLPCKKILSESYLNIFGKIKSGKNPIKNRGFYYCAYYKSNKKIILKDEKKDSRFLKTAFLSDDISDYRKIHIEGIDEIYEFSSYNFLEKGYCLNKPLICDVSAGKSFFALSELKTDDDGAFNMYFKKDIFSRTDIAEIFIASETQFLNLNIEKNKFDYIIDVSKGVVKNELCGM